MEVLKVDPDSQPQGQPTGGASGFFNVEILSQGGRVAEDAEEECRLCLFW